MSQLNLNTVEPQTPLNNVGDNNSGVNHNIPDRPRGNAIYVSKTNVMDENQAPAKELIDIPMRQRGAAKQYEVSQSMNQLVLDEYTVDDHLDPKKIVATKLDLKPTGKLKNDRDGDGMQATAQLYIDAISSNFNEQVASEDFQDSEINDLVNDLLNENKQPTKSTHQSSPSFDNDVLEDVLDSLADLDDELDELETKPDPVQQVQSQRTEQAAPKTSVNAPKKPEYTTLNSTGDFMKDLSLLVATKGKAEVVVGKDSLNQWLGSVNKGNKKTVLSMDSLTDRLTMKTIDPKKEKPQYQASFGVKNGKLTLTEFGKQVKSGALAKLKLKAAEKMGVTQEQHGDDRVTTFDLGAKKFNSLDPNSPVGLKLSGVQVTDGGIRFRANNQH
ncbi:hypothetical protein [Roseiconus lacunae]|uniref:hypothetical protein n=1 Tax=Roseiconus lacunae TaxID=2605694 RepID=UPI001E409F6A|nr:hypothetical protein [Roseiconus lacunae]MCD0457903.1 hypothetical protein [Roseiconus lacunae]